MADISKIKMPNNTSYDLKDAAARESIAALPTDIQINGTSILNNQIANIPLASTDTLGVVKANVNGLYGICVAQELVNNIPTPTGELGIAKAANSAIKSGTDNYRPIVPSVQHRSVFYGLAKAAEDTTQSTSSNAIGVYTDTAKQKIQNMLGITDLLSTEEFSTATAAHAVNSLFLMDGKLYKATAAIAIGDAVVEGTNCAQTTIDEAFLKITTASDTYALKDNPVFTGAISLGRKANTEIGYLSFAHGNDVTASGAYSNAEGMYATASGDMAHAEGTSTNASGSMAHAEGLASVASEEASHAEGLHTTASGAASHAEGLGSSASATAAHAEGEVTVASGEASHAEGLATIAKHLAQRTGGKFNIADTSSAAANQQGNYIEIIGNGTSSSARSNAYALDWSGNGYYNGYLYVGCNASSTSGTRLPHDVQVNGTSVVSNGIANIPLASTSAPGVMTIGFGLVTIDNTVQVSRAITANIKPGTEQLAFIRPSVQHASVFYGLAKAAGDTTQSQSSNSIGTYTDAAKTAIQTMLGAQAAIEVIRL